MDAELRFHLDNQISVYVKQGWSYQHAEKRARLEFGAVDLAKDECRDQRPAEWLDRILRDVRHAVRSLARNPGFVAAGILTIALGIGANAAILSVVHAVLLKPLRDAEADGDRVWAVIRSSYVNNDGRTTGYTVPNPMAQAALVTETYRRAGVDPRTVSYVEAHGTGTALGDPIEIAGLRRAFEVAGSVEGSCTVGSVKGTSAVNSVASSTRTGYPHG